jgi:hypothetical protein
MQNNQQLNEGLRSEDLLNLVHPIFDIDTYRSKMGEDRDVCVLSFKVKDRAPAKDLMEFVEKGYGFVLDADVSSGENDQGEYFVFIELSRNEKLSENIKELTHGINKLTGNDKWKFKYHKESTVHEANQEMLRKIVPETPMAYEGFMNRVKTESIKRFFSKTLMDDLSLENDIITIKKPFDKVIKLKIIGQDDTKNILENTEDTITVDQESTSEVFWLTKVLGDYNITKIGENFLFDNKGQAMLLKRID